MGKGIFGATTIIPDSIGWANCKAAMSMTSKNLQDIETWQMRNVFFELKILTRNIQHPTTDVTFHVFLHHPFLLRQKRLGDEGLAYFQNEAPDQKSQELVDRGILYGEFSSSPL